MKMVEEHHRLIVFNSIHRVMMAEMALKDQFDMVLMPVPRSITADCGMVIRIGEDVCDAVVDVLTVKGLTPVTIYCLRGEAFELVGEFS